MFILFGLIIISLMVAGGFLVAFLWAARSGQFDDDYTPSVRMLFDDEPVNQEDKQEKPSEVNPSGDTKQNEE